MAESKQQPATEQEAREVVEDAREAEWENWSFARSLFEGRLAVGRIDPPPAPDPGEKERARPFLESLETFANANIDGDAIDREGWVPDEVLQGLAELGAFGMKIPTEYGGLGLSPYTYNQALQIVAHRCASTSAFLSAHQSIGVPQPLIYFGTDEQKRAYLPRLARGELSAFALTESEVGSDPANMSTTAELSEDGEHWILNGEKLWCTNGPRADIIVVMARTPAREGVKGRRPITAFIVETAWEGVETAHICHFMGLKGISNGVLTFKNVRVPKENLLWEEGLGLKLALITLNTGRLALPAFCAQGGKAMLHTCRQWASERVQWGAPIGKHDAIAQKLGLMAADTFAMEAVADMTARMATDKSFDIRLEAAIGKMWNTEVADRIVDDALQIRGGRGYETAESLAARGEKPYPIERAVRDSRINLIFEGSSEIMRLFIAREAVDTHLSVAGDLVDPKAPMGKKVAAFFGAAFHYAWWYPTRFLSWGRWPRYSSFGPLAGHMRYAHRTAAKLARSIFMAMIRFGPKLERRQAVLGRIVEIGAELFVITSTCIRAKHLVAETPSDRSPVALAEVFCQHSRRRIKDRFRSLFRNPDVATYKLAQRAMAGDFHWMEQPFHFPEGPSEDAVPGAVGEESPTEQEPVGA
jgi:alkylation response protein AidB-like acyl-CoA dehydrogenase